MRSITFTLLSLIASPAWSAGIVDNCPCGYTTEDGSVWSEILETDFTTIKDLFYEDHGWAVQEYNVSADPQGGAPYGRSASRHNLGYGTGGLQLQIKTPVNGVIGGSEVSTRRTDMLYGSFRVGMKGTTVNGTCGAFFWFRNDSSEIDIELLSRQYAGINSLGNFVIHSPQSEADHFNAALTPTFVNQPLGFDPTTDFHEYRFDWTPEVITFFIDGTAISNMTLNVPKENGSLYINHWSNGSPDWTTGPPDQDTYITILYMKSYFNSSDSSQAQQAQSRCSAASGNNAGKTCKIPSLVKSSAGHQVGPPPSDTTGLPQSVATASATYTIAVDSTNLPVPGQVPFLSGNASNVVDEELFNNTFTGPGATSEAWSAAITEAKIAAVLSALLGMTMVLFL